MKKTMFIVLLLGSINVLIAQENIKNLMWRNTDEVIAEAHIDECVTIYAETENINDNEKVTISIWIKGDSNDDLLGEYISRVNNNQIVFYWFIRGIKSFQNYIEEVKKNGFIIPQLYFIIQYGTRRSHASNSLSVYDWLNKQLVIEDYPDIILENLYYILLLPDGTQRNGRTDAGGYCRELNLPMGMFEIELLDEDEVDDYDPEIEPIADIGNQLLFYNVREHDNLWKIAGYDFVYGNSNLWRIIFEANRHNFIDENDPDLIETGQALIIPSINNEIRTEVFWKIRELIN